MTVLPLSGVLTSSLGLLEGQHLFPLENISCRGSSLHCMGLLQAQGQSVADLAPKLSFSQWKAQQQLISPAGGTGMHPPPPVAGKWEITIHSTSVLRVLEMSYVRAWKTQL